MNKLNNVEILKVGTWNNVPITHADLEEIVNNFDKVGYKAPIKLGHQDAPGDRAFGWVTRVWKEGEKLLADFADIPQQVFEAIKEHGYDAVSSEIFFNLKRGGSVFKRALGAVALLGSRIPAVSGLKPLRESLNLSEEDSFESIISINFQNEPNKGFEMTKEEFEALQKKVQELTDAVSASSTKIVELQQERDSVKRENDRLKISFGEIEKTNRTNSIQLKLADLKVPAFKEFLAPLYEVVMGSTSEAKFSVGEAKDLSAVSVLDKLVEKINSEAEKLFSQHTDETEHGKREAVERADAKLDELALSLSKEKGIEYSEAFAAVLADPKNLELKKTYLGLN